MATPDLSEILLPLLLLYEGDLGVSGVGASFHGLSKWGRRFWRFPASSLARRPFWQDASFVRLTPAVKAPLCDTAFGSWLSYSSLPTPKWVFKPLAPLPPPEEEPTANFVVILWGANPDLVFCQDLRLSPGGGPRGQAAALERHQGHHHLRHDLPGGRPDRSLAGGPQQLRSLFWGVFVGLPAERVSFWVWTCLW